MNESVRLTEYEGWMEHLESRIKFHLAGQRYDDAHKMMDRYEDLLDEISSLTADTEE